MDANDLLELREEMKKAGVIEQMIQGTDEVDYEMLLRARDWHRAGESASEWLEKAATMLDEQGPSSSGNRPKGVLEGPGTLSASQVHVLTVDEALAASHSSGLVALQRQTQKLNESNAALDEALEDELQAFKDHPARHAMRKAFD